jgi:hypothetical protein
LGDSALLLEQHIVASLLDEQQLETAALILPTDDRPHHETFSLNTTNPYMTSSASAG